MEKIEVVLTDGTSLEGRLEGSLGDAEWVGLYLEEVHRSDNRGSIPLAKRVFVPYSNILFIILNP